MANIHTFAYNIKYDVAMAYATLNAGVTASNTPIYFNMANYDLAVFLVFTGTLTGAASLNMQMRQRIGAAGAQANLGAAVTGFTTDDAIQVLQSRGEQLTVNSGYTHVGILITETASANAVVGAILLRLRARYKQAALPA